MYNIMEVANTHAGSKEYVFELLAEFSEFNKENNFGIKFQPFKYDEIATVDFDWYDVYKELFFNEEEWNEIILEAYKTKDIWLDLFDLYGITVLKNNLRYITGLKLQTSVLDNKAIFQGLQTIDLTNIKLIINIAGRSQSDIYTIINKYEKLGVKEILLEVGFQAYPTKLEDSGLSKLNFLQEEYSLKIVFADHIDGTLEDAITLPLIAASNGASVIEKHIMHSTLETKYDHFSSITYGNYSRLISMQEKYLALYANDFINSAEEKYLSTSYQIPILKFGKEAYSLIDIENDFIYKRSNEKGLNVQQLRELTSSFHIINNQKIKNTTLKNEDFKKANIAAIIAGRLKSTRLPEKALLKIGMYSSVELCIKNTLKFSNLNHVILATSTNEQDAKLIDYTFNDSVVFHRGDPDDVIKRYLEISEKLNIDIIVRITADMPYVSSDIYEYLLKSHFENGADYTTARNAAVGTNIEIINTNALKKIKSHFPNAVYSEYMTWYFQNNPEHFQLNFVDIPKKWIRDYRLTLDYQEDLDMFNKIEEHFLSNKLEYTIDELYKFLDNNEDISKINSHLTLKYKTDQTLIDTLNSETKIQ